MGRHIDKEDEEVASSTAHRPRLPCLEAVDIPVADGGVFDPRPEARPGSCPGLTTRAPGTRSFSALALSVSLVASWEPAFATWAWRLSAALSRPGLRGRLAPGAVSTWMGLPRGAAGAVSAATAGFAFWPGVAPAGDKASWPALVAGPRAPTPLAPLEPEASWASRLFLSALRSRSSSADSRTAATIGAAARFGARLVRKPSAIATMTRPARTRMAKRTTLDPDLKSPARGLGARFRLKTPLLGLTRRPSAK